MTNITTLTSIIEMKALSILLLQGEPMYGEAGKHWNTWLPPKVKVVTKLTNNQLNKQEIFAGCEDSGAWRYQIVWRLKGIIFLCIILKILNRIRVNRSLRCESYGSSFSLHHFL